MKVSREYSFTLETQNYDYGLIIPAATISNNEFRYASIHSVNIGSFGYRMQRLQIKHRVWRRKMQRKMQDLLLPWFCSLSRV